MCLNRLRTAQRAWLKLAAEFMGENSLLCCSEGVQLCAFPLNPGPLGGVAVLLWWFGSLWVGKALQTCCHTDGQQRRVGSLACGYTGPNYTYVYIFISAYVRVAAF